MRIVASVSLVVLVAAAACGGQTQGSNVDGTQNDAGSTPADGGIIKADAGAGDATAVDSGGSDQYPAPHHPLPQLKPLGGPVLTNLKIVTITYTGESERDSLRTFDATLVAANSTWWQTVTSGYGVGPGTALPPVELDAADVANKSFDNDTTLKAYIQSLITAGKLPKPDANTLYNFYFPASTTVSLQGSQSCQAFGAYHDSKVFDVGGGTMVEAAFSIIPNCGGGRSVSSSHEIIEAATDPHPQDMTAWYAYNDAWFGAGGGEIADLCETRGSAVWNGNDVALAWSNAEAKASHDPCVPSDPNLVYFGAAVDTNEMFLSHDPTGGPDYMSEGYVSIAPGATKTVPVDVFSAAKLPHDLTIVVGKRARGGDPHNVNPITNGVTATLSATTARNGSKLTLTINAAATVAKGDYPFVVRAILENNDYHSWPVILRVM